MDQEGKKLQQTRLNLHLLLLPVWHKNVSLQNPNLGLSLTSHRLQRGLGGGQRLGEGVAHCDVICMVFAWNNIFRSSLNYIA